MHKSKRILMILLAVVVLIAGMGAAPAPASAAAACRSWHTVYRGQSLSAVGAYYGISWLYLAQVNNIRPPRYTIYPGQVLCIPAGGYIGGYPNYGTGGYPTGGVRTWSFSVVNVVPNASVTIQTSSFPSNVLFKVHMGMLTGGGYTWRSLPDLDTTTGGTGTVSFTIPAEFSGAGQLVLRLVQHKKNGKTFSQDQLFYNTNYGPGPTGGIPGPIYNPPYGYWGVPTIWIVSVRRDSTVTIQTRNFPPGVTFDVLMGGMGTRGIGGYHVGTLYSGAGGTLNATFAIPAHLRGLRQIAIRTQSWSTGYFSYNWFWNNNAY